MNRIELLDHLNLGGKNCAEIGVNKGKLSRQLLARNPKKLILVDPWLEYDDNNFMPRRTDQKMFDQRFENVTKEFGDDKRVTILRKSSAEASVDIPNNSLDFVYIDGNHLFVHVLADLFTWYEKIRIGGWLAGHDLVKRPIRKGLVGVRRAFKLFKRYVRPQEILLTGEAHGSFAIRKYVAVGA